MAPDKIYTDNRGIYAEIPVFSQADANVEYLRKDVLLEWARNSRDSAGKLSYTEFIEKIESL